MTDVLTAEQRSQCMAAIRGRDTTPERRLRSELHAMGYRYKLHSATLPGKPDIIFPSRKAVIFVHGCFWHRHDCKAGRSVPATRTEFWLRKLTKNTNRDRENIRDLRRRGWRVLVIWECQIKREPIGKVVRKAAAFLNRSSV
jgi:DNA mismatch endonuclease, patch repair protein